MHYGVTGFLIPLTRNLWIILFILLSGCGGGGESPGNQQNDQNNQQENPQQLPENQPPQITVNGPDDTSKFVGSSYPLSVLINDDGLPNDTITIEWRILEPLNANAEFSSLSAAQTDLTVYEPGNYLVGVSVTDSELTSTQSLNFQVEAVNLAPTVTAGEDLEIILPNNSLQLVGGYTDDALPGLPYSFQWKLLEPINAGVTIEQEASLTTNITFTESGAYVFQLTVSDGVLSGSDTVSVTVNDPVIGVFPRPDNQTCIAPNLSPLSPTKISLENAFPNLPDIGNVKAMKQAPGDYLHWYALIPSGKIIEFANNNATNTFIDYLNLEANVRYDNGGELGLLGMAFHPDYLNNNQVFLHYTMEETIKVKGNDVTRLRSVISRFTKTDSNWNEEIILKINQPDLFNNGGNLDFDQNGFLIISLGDGGSLNDELGFAQDRTTLLGSILRIEVDNGSPYSIPVDNPYAGNNLCSDPEIINNADFCPEIYAFGFRKPEYWSIDPITNIVWSGDSGPNSIAEINIIEPGNNYGWNVMIGSQCNSAIDPNCINAGFKLPVYEYNYTNSSLNVVPGYVYSGNSMDFIFGHYLFADSATGVVYSTKAEGNSYITTELLDTDLLISGFARAHNGDMYLLNPTPGITGVGNNIWKIVPDLAGTESVQVATNLSATGCVDPLSPTQAAPSMISYEVINPLWTDGAEKQRYFAIPDNTTINIGTNGDFEFPVGSVMMKHFILNGQFVETRLLMHHPEGWLGYSYEWNYDIDGNPTDAVLLDAGKSKSVANQTWYYPSRQDCLDCHTAATGRAIGLEALQLNRDHSFTQYGVYTSNQLLSYEQMGLFSTAIPDALLDKRLLALDDITSSYEERAKSYLHSNCAYCHSPTGPFSFDMDLRYDTSLKDMNICNVQALSGDLGLTNPLILNPAGTYDFPNSVLPLRMEADINSGNRMPPLGTELVDTQALDIIKNWINTISFCP